MALVNGTAASALSRGEEVLAVLLGAAALVLLLDEGADEVGHDHLVLARRHPVNIEEKFLELLQSLLVQLFGAAITSLTFALAGLVLGLLLSCCLLRGPLGEQHGVRLALVRIEPEINLHRKTGLAKGLL